MVDAGVVEDRDARAARPPAQGLEQEIEDMLAHLVVGCRVPGQRRMLVSSGHGQGRNTRSQGFVGLRPTGVCRGCSRERAGSPRL